jgi:hypothetical protein
MKKKFRVRHVGTSTPHEEIAYGESWKQLQSIYAMTDDKVELIEEMPYEEPKPEPKKVIAVDVQDQVLENTGSDMVSDKLPISNIKQIVDKVEDVKYFTVGGQQLMMKGDVLFEKQWTDVEDIKEYRIISKKTDKIITTEGKIIQVLDWSPVEDEKTDTADDDGSDANNELKETVVD